MVKKSKKINKKRLRKYPCDVFLKNALHFIEIGKPDIAYTEICWAILKSGGKLSDTERERFCEFLIKSIKE